MCYSKVSIKKGNNISLLEEHRIESNIKTGEKAEQFQNYDIGFEGIFDCIKTGWGKIPARIPRSRNLQNGYQRELRIDCDFNDVLSIECPIEWNNSE